jgi:hypothetical protein
MTVIRTAGGFRQQSPFRNLDGLPELSYPLHDGEVLVTSCGRICMHRKRVNVSTVMAGQKLGIKEGVRTARFITLPDAL